MEIHDKEKLIIHVETPEQGKETKAILATILPILRIISLNPHLKK